MACFRFLRVGMNNEVIERLTLFDLENMFGVHSDKYWDIEKKIEMHNTHSFENKIQDFIIEDGGTKEKELSFSRTQVLEVILFNERESISFRTLTEAAKHLGCTIRTIQRAEKSKRKLKDMYLVKIIEDK